MLRLLLLLVALARFPRSRPDPAPPARRGRDAVLAGLVGLGVAGAALAVMTHPARTISWYFMEHSLAAGGANVVNVILVDFRGFDTFGEITVLTIAGLSLVARLLLPPNQSILILGLALLPLAGTLEVSPWIIVMVLLATSQTWFFPSQNLAYMVAHAASEGRLFTHAQARKISFAYTVVTLLGLVACIPFWRMLVLM